jgi:cob(I)alamin adenosyltransferase
MDHYGTIQVYTGDGKGKTTAALGAAFRALGHGWKVLCIQFMKGDIEYGELKAAQGMTGLEIIQKGLATFVPKGNPSEEDLRLAEEGLVFAREALQSGMFNMIVLDEINVAMDYGLLEIGDVIDMLSRRPRHVELILTGRNAPREITELADTVTEMLEVRHHFHAGLAARRGIEY